MAEPLEYYVPPRQPASHLIARFLVAWLLWSVVYVAALVVLGGTPMHVRERISFVYAIPEAIERWMNAWRWPSGRADHELLFTVATALIGGAVLACLHVAMRWGWRVVRSRRPR